MFFHYFFAFTWNYRWHVHIPVSFEICYAYEVHVPPIACAFFL